MDVAEVAVALREEAAAVDERRSLVLSGDRELGYETLESVLEALDVPISETTLVGPEDRLRCERVAQSEADRLLGTTREIVILDAYATLRPNALGSLVGAVDGGGLLVLLTPPLAEWPDRRNAFDESLAVPPFAVEDVTGNFRSRLVETIREHPGIAVVDLDRERIERDGLTNPPPRRSPGSLERPAEHRFPAAAYDACLTASQVDALVALESLFETERAVVLEADRGRGKSSAAGLAAGCFVAAGEDVLVTAPAYRNAAEVFARAGELLDEIGVPWTGDGSKPRLLEASDGGRDGRDACDGRDRGGRLRFLEPADAVERAPEADVVLVDEAAALPVSTLESLLAADRIAFATTIHGYEGAGRGFSIRFRDRLAAGRHRVREETLLEPIRYAAGDPVETWAFRALLLDARPPVDQLVEGATPETTEYVALEVADLLGDEHLLREAFGLLVLAHYRTEPDDLARLLDAPNLEARALLHEDHVASVALLAREGDLPAERRAEMYEGGRIRGNMLPDVLTSQLRDESAGAPVGYRVMRIATHHAVRSRGLGSHLLERVRGEFGDDADWLGAGFGATPGLLAFWRENGFSAVHVSTTRNDASGEYSALVLSPESDAGRELRDRHAGWFLERFPAVSSDALDDLEPDVARAVLRNAGATPSLELSDHEWRVVAGAAYGPGLFDVDPGPFRSLVVRYLAADPDDVVLTDRQERLLVLRALQARAWSAVADRLEYHSTGQCMRAFGDALVPLVDRYGGAVALEVRERFAED